jgi:ankyrin repeat protein
MSNERRYQRIDADTARERLARGDVLVLDSRDPESFDLAHIPGARRLSPENLDLTLVTTPKTTPLLLCCYHGNASQTYGQMFADFGFAEVYSLDGGFAAWQRAHTKTAPPVLSPALAQWLRRHDYPIDNLDAVADFGMTPLMRAAKSGDTRMVFELLQAGAPLDTTNIDGNNALWLACVGADSETIDVLIRAGIDLDHQNDSGATCLMYAASTGKHLVVEQLLNAGANARLKTVDGFTALDMAATIDCLNLLRRMEKAMPETES